MASLLNAGGFLPRRSFPPRSQAALSDTPPSFAEVVRGLSWNFWAAFLGYLLILGVFFALRDTARAPPGPTKAEELDALDDAEPARNTARWRAWGRAHGALLSYVRGAHTVLVANTLPAAKELLERRAAIYASRPRAVVQHAILSLGADGATAPSSPSQTAWRAAQSALPDPAHAPLAAALVRALSVSPDNWADEVELYVARGLARAAYGGNGLPDGELEKHRELLGRMRAARAPLLEVWPVLARAPAWLFKPLGKLYELRDEADGAYGAARARVREEDAPVLRAALEGGMGEREQAWALAAPLREGAAPTAAWLRWCILSVLVFPTHVAPLLEELDALAHPPTPADLLSLPHTRAFAAEVARYWPPVPSLARGAARGDVWRVDKKVYDIPKGSRLFINVDALAKDAEGVADPRAFVPGRAEGPGDVGVFGFGGRRCPGERAAEGLVVLALARILHATTPALPAGAPPPRGDSFSWAGGVRGPAPFACVFDPREGARGALEKERERWAGEGV